MTEWVTHKNIEHFRELLATETDPERRRVLEKLLAQEQEKLRQVAVANRASSGMI